MNVAPARAARALCTLAMLWPAAGHAQAGPWIPVGSRLDGLASWSIAEGALETVDPLTRPFRLAALRRAAELQDTIALAPAARRAFAWLRRELGLVADSTAVSAELGLAGYRNGRRDSFREGGGSGTAALGGIWVSMVRGPFVAVINPAFENRLKDDPQFRGKTDRFITGRLQTGYLALTGAAGDLVAGRTARQWGPGLFEGLQLSPSSYAEDQLTGTLRAGRFELTTIAQRLSDYDTTLDAAVSRWFLAHRLVIRIGRGSWLALSETGVYGGPGRGFEPSLHMPLGSALLAEFNEDEPVNLLWGAEAHVRLSHSVSIQAQAVIDDIQIDQSGIQDTRPASGGYTAVIHGVLPGLPVHAAFGFTRVSNLSYRNSYAPWEIYANRNVGLARDFSDYDQLMLRLEARPAPRIHLALDASYLRQGAGDFRHPFPPDSVLAGPGQGILTAPVWRAGGVRLAATMEPLDGLLVDGAMGINGTPAGGTAAIAALTVRVRFDVLRGRLGGAWNAIDPATGVSGP